MGNSRFHYLSRLDLSWVISTQPETKYLAHSTLSVSYKRRNFMPPRTFAKCKHSTPSANITLLCLSNGSDNLRVPKRFGVKMSSQSASEFTGGQITIGFTCFSLGVDPARFNWVQQWTFLGQQKSQQAWLPKLFGSLIVGPDPFPKTLALMPCSSIPNHDQDSNFFLACQPSKPMINNHMCSLLGCPSQKYRYVCCVS